MHSSSKMECFSVTIAIWHNEIRRNATKHIQAQMPLQKPLPYIASKQYNGADLVNGGTKKSAW